MKLKYILFFILMQSLIVYLVNIDIKEKKELVFKNEINKLQVQYKSILNNFQKMADSVFSGYINRPEHIEAVTLTDRDGLNNLLSPYYKYLKADNFERIHFILPNNESFFRLDEPSSFGFNFKNSRYSINYVNKNHKKISGLEMGKLNPSFRYVYPLFENKKYIACVENSLSIEEFLQQLEKMYDVHSHFIIKKEIVDTKVIKRFKYNSFEESLENSNYYMLKRSKKVQNKRLKSKIKDIIKTNYSKIINNNINNSKAFTFEFEIKNTIKTCTLLPVLNIQKNNVGYFVIYENSKELEELNKRYIYNILLFSLLNIIILIAIYLDARRKHTLEIEVKKKTKELNKLNKSLEKRIEKEIIKNRNKELELMESSKLIQMGEMIGNIAHQWRQPLNTISATASSMILCNKLKINDEEENIKKLEKISESSKYLSETINIFRNFIEDKKEYKEYNLQDSIKDALKIVRVSLEDNFINVIDNIDYENNIKIKMVSGELSEVIINILNNAKDAILENHIKNPWINIEITNNKNNIILSIEDNALGIDNKIINKIFDPYFSTKYKKQGTGLGLHMSKKIIEESLGGKLSVKNTKYGAKFCILFKNTD